MNIVVFKEHLKKALSFVNKAVSTKTQLPILSNVLISTEEGRVKIAATNLETSISFWIGATVEEQGSITVPARLFTELISSISSEKVLLKDEKGSLVMEGEGSQVSLGGIDAQEYPPLPTEGGEKFSLKTKGLVDSLPFVLISASSDEGRPVLTGVKLGQWGGKTALVATDGFRLSIKQTEEKELNRGVVIPARFFAEVSRAITEERVDTVDLYLEKEKSQAVFSLPHSLISTRLIEGEFPPFEKIVPTSHVTRLVFSKEEAQRAIKLAAVYAKEASNIIKLTASDTSLVVTSNTPQLGKNSSVIETRKEGEDMEVAFNVKYLIDLLSVLPGEDVVFESAGPLSPGLFKSLVDDSCLHVIMPVRVQG